MLFSFKKYNEDFYVEEDLGFSLSWKGDVFYVQFEKKDMNTMFIIQHLCKSFQIERKSLGISGLKDKNAITRQRISIYKSVIKKIGGEKIFLEKIGEITKVISFWRHNEPLQIWRHEANIFKIKLRFSTPITELESTLKQTIEHNIQKIKNEWFPNCFWQQRFGKGNRNFKRACAILEEKKTELDDIFELRFKLQAFSSMYFNHYALSRRKKWQKILQWDIVTNTFHARKTKVGIYNNQEIQLFDYQKCKQHYEKKEFFEPNYLTKKIAYNPQKWIATGPILWYNILTCPNGSKAFFKDREIIKKSNMLTHIKKLKRFQLRWIRRPLRVLPKNVTFHWTEHYLELSFTLPTWAYATVLLWFLFQDIDKNTCIQNKLTLPDEIVQDKEF